MKNTMIALSLLCASAAFAQSHSVTNYSNPPGTSAASQAATDATPGRSATADKQDAKHGSKAKASSKKKTAKKKSAKRTDEAAMEQAPSEKSGTETERHAFDNAPAKR